MQEELEQRTVSVTVQAAKLSGRVLKAAIAAALRKMEQERKYDITKHPNYKYLSDHNPKNAFDIEKFLSTRLSLRPGEPYRSYEISPEELTENTA